MKDNAVFIQSAALPFFLEKGELKIVLVTSRSNPKQWVIPKGMLEFDLTPELSAAKEALEEAGVRGNPDGSVLGSFFYQKWGMSFGVDVYPLRVTKVLDFWDEKKQRERKIISLEEAFSLVNKDLQPLFRKLQDRICKERNSQKEL